MDDDLQQIAREYIAQIQWARDRNGPYVGPSNPPYRNDINLYVKHYHPSLVGFTSEIVGYVRTFWKREGA